MAEPAPRYIGPRDPDPTVHRGNTDSHRPALRTAPVLAHPSTPEHHLVLAGERYGVTLPWPPQVHQVTGVLLLPPTVTPRGPITWTQHPQHNSLQLCREIDIFGALRTVLSDFPPHP
jgi:hypothetical protein